MQVQLQDIPDVLLITPHVFHDERGYFYELHNHERYVTHGIGPFVQDNVSKSHRGTIRGLHLQNPHGQGKLVSVLHGEIYDVAVDVRRGSPTFCGWVGVVLSDKNNNQLYIPPGFAHGFCVISSEAIVVYKCTESYDPTSEIGLAFNDFDINWPTSEPIMSDKDRNNLLLSEAFNRLPLMEKL
jgi:dTDP-4-dehydrorhamnose 3,5-epimerase